MGFVQECLSASEWQFDDRRRTAVATLDSAALEQQLDTQARARTGSSGEIRVIHLDMSYRRPEPVPL